MLTRAAEFNWLQAKSGIFVGTGGRNCEIDRKSTLHVGWRAADYGSADIRGTGPSLTADTIEFGFQQSF